MWRKIALSILLISILLIAFNFELVVYGVRQAKGQFTIIWNAKPVEEYLARTDYPDSLKQKLRLIEKVRRFAIDSLGLQDSDNYKTMFDQQGEEIMWVVTASEKYKLKPKEWHFPVLGAVPYKGYFNKALAIDEAKALQSAGWDVSVRNPGGWSTLGWFTDPILSGMLERTDGDLASLIIHELVHATIFVKDSVEFNENLASFIGDRGAELFLRSTFGDTSNIYKNYVIENREFERYVNHILHATVYLDSVYTAMETLSAKKKEEIKQASILRIFEQSDTLALTTIQKPSARYRDNLPNNTYFLSFQRYQSRQDIFWNLWEKEFESDLKKMISYLQAKHPSL